MYFEAFMKTIKLMFSGMDGCFDEQDNFITNVLKILKYVIIQIF